MIRINLLPHREMRRDRRRKDFIAMAVLFLLLAGALALLVGVGIGGLVDAQEARNEFITQENAKLDTQVKEIALLRDSIDALNARRDAVENLQRDRTLPVRMLDELAKRTPSGIYFRQVRQDDRKVTLIGWAQSNEQVSALMRGLADDSPWLERPELVEIKASDLQAGANPALARLSKDARRIFEFSMTAMIKAAATDPVRPAAATAPGAAPAPGAAAPAAAGPGK